MSHFGQNIKKIRKIKQISQSQFAELFGLTRASIGAYEEGRSEAKIDTIIHVAKKFSITVDSLLTKELTVNDLYHFDIVNKDLDRYHHIKENGTIADFTGIPLVSDKIYNEYLVQMKNKDFINQLPKMKLPVSHLDEMMAFVHTGNSMYYNNHGILHDDIVIAKETSFDAIENDKTFVIVTKSSITVRNFKNKQEEQLVFSSLNPDYSDLSIDSNDIQELWQVKYLFTKHINSFAKDSSRIDLLEERLRRIEKKLE